MKDVRELVEASEASVTEALNNNLKNVETLIRKDFHGRAQAVANTSHQHVREIRRDVLDLGKSVHLLYACNETLRNQLDALERRTLSGRVRAVNDAVALFKQRVLEALDRDYLWCLGVLMELGLIPTDRPEHPHYDEGPDVGDDSDDNDFESDAPLPDVVQQASLKRFTCAHCHRFTADGPYIVCPHCGASTEGATQ
jgi:hypothetical protein